MQIQNLLYVVGAVAFATLISGLYVLRHRKPKSLEAGIESFSRELKALAPERRPAGTRDGRPGTDNDQSRSRRTVRPRPIARRGVRSTTGVLDDQSDERGDHDSQARDVEGSASAEDGGSANPGAPAPGTSSGRHVQVADGTEQQTPLADGRNRGEGG